MRNTDLIREKTNQASSVLAERDVDLWLTFCRETAEISEPSLPLLLGYDVVWPTALLVTKEGRSAVVVGRHDAPNAADLPHEVYPYDESLEEPFLDLLAEIDPAEIAVNYSADDVTADGLTHGMHRRLRELLDGTPYADRLTSAEEIVSEVRGVKSAAERDRVRRAVEATEKLLGEVTRAWTAEWTERDVSDWLHVRMRERGFESAWSWDQCPSVHAGSESEVGHTTPGDGRLPAGEVLHIDFGVKRDGYCADVQRLFYRPSEADQQIPDELAAAFADVRAAIDAGREALEPGAVGHEVDAAARDALTERGWPEFAHAFGHQVGRNAHDGGTLLGPRWDRYGSLPDGEVRVGQIYAVELGVRTEWGYLGQEEMVEVTADGAEWLTDPQEGLWKITE